MQQSTFDTDLINYNQAINFEKHLRGFLGVVSKTVEITMSYW